MTLADINLVIASRPSNMEFMTMTRFPVTGGFWFRLRGVAVGLMVAVSVPATSTGDIPAEAPFIFVNQSGYNAEAPQRFTAINFPTNAAFIVRTATAGDVLFTGTLNDQHIGDFSAMRAPTIKALVVQIGDVTSDPFRVGPWWLERVSYDLAMEFMVQSRNHVGNVETPAGYTYAWRDDHHFAFHLRTLVSQFLSHPQAYLRMDSSVTYPEPVAGVWGALKPYDESAPNIVKLIHWAADTTVTQNLTHEFFKGDLAFFLYAWPWMEAWLDKSDYHTVLDFVLTHWEQTTIDQEYPFDESAADGHDLFALKTTIGSPKGAYPPGFSILPNALMAHVLERSDDPRAPQFREAARAQVAWVTDHIDVEAPALTKGQRMSADLLMSGLAGFARLDPTGIPPNFAKFVDDWSSVVIRRSSNLWDFFQHTDDGHWVVYVDGHETKWNDPGSVLALPSAVLSAAGLVTDAAQRDRLREIAYAAMDHAFGRNPTGRHFIYDAPREIEGVERGWYSFYVGGVGELEDVPFTFDGAPKAPSYPYNPEVGNISWTEGWVSFNTAFNRSLAAMAYFETELKLEQHHDKVELRLRTPWNFDYATTELLELTLVTSTGDREVITLQEMDPLSSVLGGQIITIRNAPPIPHNGTLEVETGDIVSVAYGHGYYSHRTDLTVE